MGGAGQLQAAPHHWIKQRCLAGIGEFVETRFCKMFLVKRFKCLLVAFLLLSASPTTLSHGQEYQSTNGANQRVPMCVACCTITLVAMILLVCFLVTHPYAATQTWITTSGCMCRFLRHLLTAAVIIGTFTVIDSLLNDSSNQMVFHHGVRNATSKAISLPIAFVGGRYNLMRSMDTLSYIHIIIMKRNYAGYCTQALLSFTYYHFRLHPL